MTECIFLCSYEWWWWCALLALTEFSCTVCFPFLRLEILLPCYNKLVEPSLTPTQSLNGDLVKKLFHQKSIYVRPDKIILSEEKESVSSTDDFKTCLWQWQSQRQYCILHLIYCIVLLYCIVFICLHLQSVSDGESSFTNDPGLAEISHTGKYFYTIASFVK